MKFLLAHKEARPDCGCEATPEARPRQRVDLRGAALPLAAIALWWALSASHLVKSSLLVSPADVISTAYEQISSGALTRALSASLAREACGFAIGATAGFLLGGALGLSRIATRVVGPSFDTFKQISLFAWIPLISVWFGLGDAAKVVFLSLAALLPVAAHTCDGIHAVPRKYVELAQALRYSRLQLVRHVLLPAALPSIFTGLYLALIYSWLATLGAEYLLVAGSGIGNLAAHHRTMIRIARQTTLRESPMSLVEPEGLDILHVSKRYGAGESALAVLDDVTLHVRPGEFVSVLGASGCGKSTLLRLIAGLDAGYSGAIMMRGERVDDTSLERGIVFQDHRLFPWLTAEQNILAALRNAPLSARQKHEAVTEHIALVGLTGFEKAYPHQLSGGMAQRVAIARGLVNRPRVLLLDEPFGALDTLTRGRLQNELLRIWEHERITMLLVTHDVDEAIYLGDRVVTMAPRPGRIRRIVDVTLPRPRERADPRFVRLRDEILSDFPDSSKPRGDTPLPPTPTDSSDQWRMAW